MFDSIIKEAQANVDKKTRKVVVSETRNITDSTPVKVIITQEFLPPDKSKWMVVETRGNNIEQTEIIYDAADNAIQTTARQRYHIARSRRSVIGSQVPPCLVTSSP